MIEAIDKVNAWEEALIREQHQRRLLEDSDRQRLIRAVSKHATTSRRLVLARLGKQLVKWGYDLQAEYGTRAEASGNI